MIKLKGKILDEDGTTIPSARIFISDKDGKVVNDKAQTRSNLEGEYALPFAIPMPVGVMGANVPVPIGKYVTIMAGGYPNRTLSLEDAKVNPFDPKSYNNFNIPIVLDTQELKEFTVVASKDAFECNKKGGTWDEKTKTCKLPKSWFAKNKFWVLGGGALLLSATIFIIAKRNKNK